MSAEAGFGFSPSDTVVVTGGGSGIGRACVLAAAAQGLGVAVLDLDAGTAAAVAAEIVAAGGRASGHGADVTDEAAVTAALAAVAVEATPRYLVNNAGPPSSSRLGFAEGLAKSAGSMEAVTRLWLALDPPPQASVVFVSSIAGNLIGGNNDWYASGKAAIAGYMRRTALAEAGRLRANAVGPGLTDTPRMTGFVDSEVGRQMISRIPLARMGRPEDVAWTVLFLLSPRAAYVTGTLVPVDGGVTIAG